MRKATLPKSKLVKSQFKKEQVKLEDGNLLVVNIRYDDECGNKHNSFAITGSVYEPFKDGNGYKKEPIMCGCIHDEIIKYRPDLKKYIKWHLTSSDGPMHYLANALYLAGDKDYNGKHKGEVARYKTSIFFNDVPIPFEKYDEKFCKWLESNKDYNFDVVEVAYEPRAGSDYKFSPKYTFTGYVDTWYTCPFDSKMEADNFLKALKTCKVEYRKQACSWGEGKEPELDAARNAAVWPEAKAEDFTKEKLLNRLPKLMKEFKKDMEALGFKY